MDKVRYQDNTIIGGVDMAQRSSYYFVEGLQNSHDEKAIKNGLDTLPGVKSVSTNTTKHQVCVDYDNTGVSAAALLNKLFTLGFEGVMLRDVKR